MGPQAQTKADSSRVLEVRTVVTLGVGLHRAIHILKSIHSALVCMVTPLPQIF